MNEELKPCPFCGSDARWIDKSGWSLGDSDIMDGYGDAGCTSKGCYLYDGADFILKKPDSVEMWNARAKPKAPQRWRSQDSISMRKDDAGGWVQWADVKHLHSES